MNPTPGLVLPSYYEFHTRPVKLLESPAAGMTAWALDWDTGGWVRATHLVDEILFAIGGDVFKVSPANFVDLVESTRGRFLKGDGPVFALYETIESIIASAEGRRMTPEELALIRGLRRKTYRMFEEALRQRGDPAAEPDLLGA
jgi:hypothetical protein